MRTTGLSLRCRVKTIKDVDFRMVSSMVRRTLGYYSEAAQLLEAAASVAAAGGKQAFFSFWDSKSCSCCFLDDVRREKEEKEIIFSRWKMTFLVRSRKQGNQVSFYLRLAETLRQLLPNQRSDMPKKVHQRDAAATRMLLLPSTTAYQTRIVVVVVVPSWL